MNTTINQWKESLAHCTLPAMTRETDLISLMGIIGRNIKSLREEKGISQAELARQSGISITTLNEIETRQSGDVRLSTLSAVARTLELPVVVLLKHSDVDLSSRDQAQLLKASEAIARITRKLRND